MLQKQPSSENENVRRFEAAFYVNSLALPVPIIDNMYEGLTNTFVRKLNLNRVIAHSLVLRLSTFLLLNLLRSDRCRKKRHSI